jgi:hypothetical protein
MSAVEVGDYLSQRVGDYLNQLREKLPYVPPVPVQAIKKLHRKGDFGGVVRLIRQTMNVGVNLTLHWTSGPPAHEKAQAWVKIPPAMPYYGTPEFKALKVDMFILKSFRDTSTWAEFAIVIAHELSHVVLDSIRHPLRDEEKAVDLTAMLLGFSFLYRDAAHTLTRTRTGFKTYTYKDTDIGYLSEWEVIAAAKILVPYQMRARRVAIKIARRSAIPIAIFGGFFFFIVWIALHNTPETHSTPLRADYSRTTR